MDIFDSHAHYDDDSFNEDRIKVIEELKDNNIIGVLNCGSSFKGALDSVNLAKKYDFFYAAVGIHPEYADTVDENILQKIKDMASYSKVKAIGEIGLDYYHEDNPPKEVQKEVFMKQMKLAMELSLPVVIHDRDAHKDTLDIMQMFPQVHGVVHCFSGSVEFARECLKLGYYIGFTGVVTFKNARKTLEVAKEVPIDKILVETDCPYMAPEPHRGKRNRSEYIEQIIKKIAQVREISEEELNDQLILNTKQLLNIK